MSQGGDPPVCKTSVVRTNDGVGCPVLGVGVYQAKCGGETEQAVLWALQHGYRLIDTAAAYRLVLTVANLCTCCGNSG